MKVPDSGPTAGGELGDELRHVVEVGDGLSR
jgi:hypothetical protein